MTARTRATDPYAVLQLPPDVDHAEVTAAYERLRQLYDPQHTANAAPELQALAAAKRDEIEAAYRALTDPGGPAQQPRQRSSGAVESIDYAPLPPARGQERARTLQATETSRARQQPASGPMIWLAPVLVGSVTLALLLLLVLSGVRVTDGPEALPTPTVVLRGGARLPYSDAQINQLRVAAETSNTAVAWQALGDALFDTLQTLREQAPQSPQYRGLLPRWLEAVDAYERSLVLVPSPTVDSDRALALYSYGADAPDPQRRAEALAAVDQAIGQDVREPRALLNYGLVLSMAEPSRRDAAFELWRKVVEVAPDAPEADRARVLLESYGQDLNG